MRRPRGFVVARRVGLGALAALVLAMFVGTGYQYLGNRRDLRDYPAPGQLVDVGGHRLHLWCTGAGSPVAVLDAGIGGSSLDWSRVQPEVASFTRVCSYDRAGMGWSDGGPRPRTGTQIVGELQALLRAAHVPSPYVLVGHSSGGLHVRLYASTHPNDVAGIVLVDAAHEDASRRMPRQAGAQGDSRFPLYLHAFLTVVGYARVDGIWFARAGQFSPEAQRLANGIKQRTEWPFAYASESLAFEETAAEVRKTRHLLNVPLMVVTRGRYAGVRRLPTETQERIKHTWQELQTDLVRLSPLGAQVVASNADHYIQFDQPEIVIKAIETMVTAARRDAR